MWAFMPKQILHGVNLYVSATITRTRRRRSGKDWIGSREPAVQIEAGCNEITAGKYEDGISLLEPFLSSRFNDWWPLHYYLGVAYEMTGRRSEAVSAFRKVLQLNGSHLETMKELMSIYEDEGDRENTPKIFVKRSSSLKRLWKKNISSI